MTTRERTALILVDLQNDFMPEGALAVPGGDLVVPVANELAAGGGYGLVVATQDWHPAGHGSFASSHPGRAPGESIDLNGVPQVLWPDHCVQGTPGASFHSALDVAAIDLVVRKGTDPGVDSYSAFHDAARRGSTGLAGELRDRRVEAVHVMGLAMDYCVRFTAEDALDEGFAVTLLTRGCRAVDLEPGDGARAIDHLAALGARIQQGDR